MNSTWICTDEDENQWGRQINNHTFEFKQDIKLPNESSFKKVNVEINLEEFRLETIEDAINSYGYSLYRSKEGKFRYIYEESIDPYFLIAEMLFEYLFI